MVDHILRHLRAICKLLAALDREAEPERKAPRFARVYGMQQGTSLRVFVTVQPIYPDHQGYQPLNVIRGKAYRMKLARCLEDEICNEIVGYKVKVRIENV